MLFHLLCTTGKVTAIQLKKMDFVYVIYTVLNKFNVLVLLLSDAPGMFRQEDFARLVGMVDYFSLMTYDYSSAQRPGKQLDDIF